MASAANIATSSNPLGSVQNTVSGQKDVPNKPTMKSTGSVKMGERGRKDVPIDTGRRPPQKAWTTGNNPITQRGSTPTQANGNSAQPKTVGIPKMAVQKETGLSDKHGHDRLRFILAAAVGLTVILTTKSGDNYEGIFAGSTTSSNGTKFTMKMTRKVSHSGSQINGAAAREAALVGASPEHAMTFDSKDMADLLISQFTAPETSRYVNGANSSFQTDTDISGNSVRGPRALQKWEPDGPEGTDFSLETGATGQWDQFATHNQMFGDRSTYDEILYTTEIDRSAPGYKQREAEAARIAREIEGSASTNAHVLEERNQTNEHDKEDEESKYSGVQRDESAYPALSIGGPNKYTPPARRPPTNTATVPGAPVDTAIISAQISKPATPKAVSSQLKDVSEKVTTGPTPADIPDQSNTVQNGPTTVEPLSKPKTVNTSSPPQAKVNNDNPSDDVENQVLSKFRDFANAERARIAERKRVQASQDRTAKINDLMRFSKTFKLKTPIPSDLVGILAKDPVKQEAIIEKAQKDHEEAKTTSTPATTPTTAATASSIATTTAANSSVNATAFSSASKPPPVTKFDASQVPPPIPDRQTFNKGRGSTYLQNSIRNDRLPQQTAQFAGRGTATFTSRTGSVQDRKNQVPAPIPMPPDGRTPPIGPMADQANVASPQRSTMVTPASALAPKMNARAMEFRPTAPTVNPTTTSNAPSSPASTQRAGSISRAASPSSFFGSRKPKALSERPSVSANFNPIKRMRQEIEARKVNDKSEEPIKDYPSNGGIPNAYHTGPVWLVRDENKDKTYLSAFQRPSLSASPSQNRTTSSHHLTYQGQIPPAANGTIPQISTPQHGPHVQHHYGHQFDEHRMHMQAGPANFYASPAMAPRQMSNLSSPMTHQAQLNYGQAPYYGAPGGQMPMQMRQYPTTPGMIPGQMAAPLMTQQASSGPYMTVPQGYNQMQMYSPSPGHVYPQQNGYPSPGRVAPMMMQQGSQQSHHGGQQVMYTMPGQTGPMMYGQQSQMGMMRSGYGAPQAPYNSSPHQPHHMQQRAMSSGYNQKALPQAMQSNQGPPSNAPQQPAAFAQMEMSGEDAK